MSWREEHVNRELLAYLDDELEAETRARVEAHLALCEACTRELEQLRGLRAGLSATLPTALERLELSAAGARRIRRRLEREQARGPGWQRWWDWIGLVRELWRRRVALTYVALTLLVAVFGLNVWRSSRIAETGDQQETLVLAHDQFAPGSPAALRVLVRDATDATPVPDAEVTVSVDSRAPGKARRVLFAGRTDAFGTTEVQFTVPEDLEGEADLVIETHSNKGADEVTHPIQIVRSYKLLLSSDKPVYQPGQTIHLRALALGALDRRPPAGETITLRVVNPNGDRLVQREVTASAYGIAGLDFALDSQAPSGTYTLQATLGDTSSERRVNVQPYSLPKFQVRLETARSYYRPGDRVEGWVQADYFFDKPVAGGEVTLRGWVYDPTQTAGQVIELYGQTGADGRFAFGFDLPSAIVAGGPEEDLAQFELRAEVVDQAQHREQVSRLLPVTEQLILIDAVPESGLLKPGVENVLFLLTSYPDGRPAETTLTVEVQGRQSELQTGPYGLAEFRFVPTGERVTLRVTAHDAAGARAETTVELDTDATDDIGRALLLRAERAAYRIGETLRLEALVPTGAAEVVYLDVVKAGQTILATAAPVQEGRATWAVDLDERFWGTLELHAYRVLADGEIVRDTRIVVVDAPREIAIAIAADRESYRPGETAALEFQTSQVQESGASEAVPAALGIGIVDASVYALEEQTPGFARVYFLLQKELLQPTYELHGFELPSLLEAEEESPVREAQDRSAKAAWAGAPATPPQTLTQSYAEKLAALLTRELEALHGLGNWLVRALTALPLLLAVVAIWGLQPTGALKKALRRVGRGIGLLILTSPVTVPVVGAALWLAWEILGTAALVLTSCVWLLAWADAAFYAWRGGDRRVQVAGGLVAAYLVLVGLMAFVAAQEADPTSGELMVVALTYLLALASLVTLGQGLIVEGARHAGWALTALGLLLVPLMLFTASAPGVASDFVRALGSPTVYTLPGGLLTGCAGAGDEPLEVTRAVQETEKETVMEEAAAEEEPAGEPTVAPLATPTPAPTPVALEPTAEAAEPEPSTQPPRLRQFFPETLYWAAEAVTDESGYLALEVPLADSITTWRLTALAASQEGRLGAATYGIRVFQPFFVDLDLPPALTQGDEVRVPVAVYNYLSEPQEVRLALEAEGPLALSGSTDARTLAIAGNDIAVLYFPVRAEGHGTGRLTVTATSPEAADAVAREIRVEPNGAEQRESLSNRLEQEVEIELALPEAAIPGTGRLEVRLYAGQVAQLLQGLASMLQKPTGCFEQTSSANYPNVLILQAADEASSGVQIRPEVRLQAEHYVATGYQRLLSYEVPGGGFSLFGDAPAGLMLTAYGLMEFSDMAQVYPVDPQVIQRTAEWLFSQQADDGAWDPQALGYSHHESWAALADARLPTTAYVAWALVEASAGPASELNYADDPRLQFALNYLARSLEAAEDPYVLALVANALSAAGRSGGAHSDAARQAVDRLRRRAQVEGELAHWQSETESFSGAVGASAGLETTALATYALLQDGRYPDLAEAGLLYLVRQRDDRGGWRTTQATVLALKAFNRAARLQGPEPVEAAVGVYLDGELAREVRLTPENADVVHTVYLEGLEAGTSHRLRLEVDRPEPVPGRSGSGLLYQTVLAYHVPWDQAPAPAADGPLDIQVSYDRTALPVDETLVANVRLSLDQPGAVQWGLVELGLPPGFEVVAEDLEALIAQSASQKTRLKRYEVAGRTLRLYLENLRGAVRFNFRLRARLVVRAQTGAATVYDYYNPTLRDVQPPHLVVVAP